MYAIIRTGGKQSKVREGDILDVEQLAGDDEVSFTPLLVVDAKGKVVSDRKKLSTAAVTAKVLGPSAGPKIDIFKYKNKTGYRRRQGHRQKYTRIEILKIKAPKAEPKKAAAADEDKPADAKKPAAKATAAKATAAKATAAKKPAAKKPAATKKPAPKEEA